MFKFSIYISNCKLIIQDVILLADDNAVANDITNSLVSSLKISGIFSVSQRDSYIQKGGNITSVDSNVIYFYSETDYSEFMLNFCSSLRPYLNGGTILLVIDKDVEAYEY